MTHELPVEELEAMANIEVGEALRRTRIHYRQTLEDIEAALRIRSSQIDAIERGDIKQLPGRVYAIGFVRNYAEYLGLDGAKVVQLFKAQYMDNPANDSLSFPVPASETKTPPFWLFTLSMILACAFFIAIYSINRIDQTDILKIDDVPKGIKTHVNRDILLDPPIPEVSGPIAETTDDVVVENMGDNQKQNTGIILNINGSSWVEIKNSEGEVLVSEVLNSGDQYFVPDSPGLSISLGNAANVEILLNGRALKPLGKDGDVRRDIPLNSAYLGTLEFQNPEPSEAGVP